MSRRIASLFVVSVVFAVSAACNAFMPELEVLTQNLRMDVVKTNGEDDWAYILDVTVRNKGAAGRVRAKARVRTPSGQQLYREAEVALARDERKNLQFVFTEPTFVGDVLSVMSQADAKSAGATYEFSYDIMP